MSVKYSDEEIKAAINALMAWGSEAGSSTAVFVIEQLRAERDEADKRAGAAERNAEQLADERRAREAWLTKAKAAWGVDDRVSFDVVWAQALEARAQLKAIREALASYRGDLSTPEWKAFKRLVSEIES